MFFWEKNSKKVVDVGWNNFGFTKIPLKTNWLLLPNQLIICLLVDLTYMISYAYLEEIYKFY
jgi:hypothetical protein